MRFGSIRHLGLALRNVLRQLGGLFSCFSCLCCSFLGLGLLLILLNLVILDFHFASSFHVLVVLVHLREPCIFFVNSLAHRLDLVFEQNLDGVEGTGLCRRVAFIPCRGGEGRARCDDEDKLHG